MGYWSYAASNILTPMLLVTNMANKKKPQKTSKMIETLAYGYSSESTHWELSNEYHNDRD